MKRRAPTQPRRTHWFFLLVFVLISLVLFSPQLIGISPVLRGVGNLADSEYRHATWAQVYKAFVLGGDAQFTSGSIASDDDADCVDPSKISGKYGAFTDPAHFYSASSIVQFDGDRYADGNPRLVDLRASCCRSEHRWPKCWADDVSNTNASEAKVLNSMHPNARAYRSRNILAASLANNVLTLRCAGGSEMAQYSESIGSFQWKRMPKEATKISNIKSPAVIVRCYCSRGWLQRAREYVQLHLHEYTPNGMLRQKSFLERYWQEDQQCIESDLMLTQAVERRDVKDRLKQIWRKNEDKNDSQGRGGLKSSTSPLKPFVNVIYFFYDSTSRRHWVNNARETGDLLRDLAAENIATTFGFPFFHSLGYGTTERAFNAGLGGSRIPNFGTANFSEWRMLNRVWDRARDAGWYTSLASEGCFAQEFRSLFSDASSNMTLAEKFNSLGDHTMYDAFCGACDVSVEAFCDSGKKRKQYRSGTYYTKNFLADERSCEGGRRPSSNFLEFTRKAMDLYGNGEFPSLHVYEWGSAHLFREEKHVCAAMRHFDASLAAFLREMKEDGFMNRTVLIQAGDHGNWNIEENSNPMVSITAPNWWLIQQGAMQSLHDNQREVTTHLDLHATVMDIIRRQTGPRPLSNVYSSPTPKEGVPQLPKKSLRTVDPNGWRGWRYDMPGFPGKSLLRRLPLDRGCTQAGIDEFRGACLISSKKKGKLEDVTEKIKALSVFERILAESMVHATNSNLDSRYRTTCKPYAFDSLHSVKSMTIPDDRGMFKFVALWFSSPFSTGAQKREFRCEVYSKANPFHLESMPRFDATMLEVTPKMCKQITTWGMNKDCMPKGIGKKEQEFCNCLNDADVDISRFRL